MQIIHVHFVNPINLTAGRQVVFKTNRFYDIRCMISDLLKHSLTTLLI